MVQTHSPSQFHLTQWTVAPNENTATICHSYGKSVYKAKRPIQYVYVAWWQPNLTNWKWVASEISQPVPILLFIMHKNTFHTTEQYTCTYVMILQRLTVSDTSWTYAWTCVFWDSFCQLWLKHNNWTAPHGNNLRWKHTADGIQHTLPHTLLSEHHQELY